jgi:hypothetical protein
MENIQNFKGWINEARLSIKVDVEELEKIYTPENIVFPAILSKYFNNIKIEEIKKECSKLLAKEYDTRLNEKLKWLKFSDKIATGYPIMEAHFRFMGKFYPLNVDIPADLKSNQPSKEGNQIYIPIIENIARAIKIFKDEESHEEINKSIEFHAGINKVKYDEEKLKYVVTKPNDDYDYRIVIQTDGTVLTEEESKKIPKDKASAFGDSKIQSYNLKKGKPIRFASKLGSDGFVTGKVFRIINKKFKKFGRTDNWAIFDDHIEMDLEFERDGKTMKIHKMFKPDDIIYLPLGDDKKFVRCEVQKPFYVSNPVLKEPINLRIKVLK